MPLSLSAATNDLSGLLQKGLFEEEANRNLDAATAAYQTLVLQFDKDRQIGATAIFRLGEVYRKQGKTNEAAAQYERIVRDFAEQTTLVTLSRQNLAGMNKRPDNLASQTSPKDLEPDLAQLKKLSQAELLQVLPTLVPDQLLTKLLEQLQTMQTRQVELIQDLGPTHPDVKRLVAVEKTLHEQIDQRVTGILKALELRSPASGASKQTAAVTTVADDEEAEIRRIQAMIQNSPDLINAPFGDPALTPLCRAAKDGQLRVAKFLLEGSAAVDRRSRGSTPLHYAADAGHRAMVEFLLQRGADVNARNPQGQTALHLAAENGFQTVAEGLVTAKADVNAITSKQETPLLLAAGKGHAELVKFLIAKGAQLDATDERDFTAVTWAALRGHSETLTALLAAKANPDVLDKGGRTPLSYAAGAGHFDSVMALLAAKANPNTGSMSLPLHAAINRKTPLVVEALLRADANANRKAAIGWQFSVFGSVYGSGTSVPDLTPLSLAVKESNFEAVKLLLRFKADPNGAGPDGLPLIFSVLDQPEILEAFLDAGANPNKDPAPGRWPPLASTRTAASVALLLAKGADIEDLRYGITPLLFQAEWGTSAVVEALLKGGANIHARKPDGQTALHLAASARNLEMISALLAYKADVNARDKSGLTPLDLVSGNRKQSRLVNGTFQPFNDSSLTDKTAGLLREHGGLTDLPKVDGIEVRRPDTGYSKTVFSKGTNDWNRFTLLEAIFANYYAGSVSPAPARRLNDQIEKRAFPEAIAPAPGESALPFPNLHRIVVVRPNAKPGQPAKRITVDLLLPTGVLDCTKDMPLEFGDVIEIPEREHTLQEGPVGLTLEELKQITRCREGTVELIVRDKRTELKVWPWSPEAAIASVLARQEARTALFSSSDLSRVKVKRPGSANEKSREWLIDCSSGKSPDLWLRDGDVIEVPDKP